MQAIKVEIWSDIVCPWCYIGKRRFEAALAQFAHHSDVEIVWRSFELDPNAPHHTSGTLNDMLSGKMGISLTQAKSMNDNVSQLAAQEGLEYRLDKAKPGNTFNAHRLIHLAAQHGLQGAAKERLMHAYFTEGVPIGDTDTLISLGIELGLAEADVRAALGSDQYADEVRADEQLAGELGIRGVPFYVINERYGLSGAQPAATFLQALEQVWQEQGEQA